MSTTSKKKQKFSEQELFTYAKELQNTVTLTGLSLDAWWAIQTTPHRALVQNRYVEFFQCSDNAHFSAFALGFYRLFETNPKTYNIPGLIRLLREEGKLTDAQIEGFKTATEKLKPLWVKVSILRNKAIGHREVGLTFEEVFRQAALTPGLLLTLYEGTRDLLNEITQARFHDTHLFNLGSKEAVIRMHEDLANYWTSTKASECGRR